MKNRIRTKHLQKSIVADFAVLNIPILSQIKKIEATFCFFYVCNSTKETGDVQSSMFNSFGLIAIQSLKHINKFSNIFIKSRTTSELK